MWELENDWADVLRGELEQPYVKQLQAFLEREYEAQRVYPGKENVLNALRLTAYRDAKAVILGQDPYHGPGQAHGLSFSVQPGTPHPPSLQNMFKELKEDLGIPVPKDGSLIPWAKQGVLLLNTVLTVREGAANSHRNQGWERFTDAIIQSLNERERPLVFLLWGAPAQKKAALLDQEKHRIIATPHPSPLSAYRGFFGSRPYSRANQSLSELGLAPIDWSLGS